MYALYSPEPPVLERVRAALPRDEGGVVTTSWSEFEACITGADCLLIASRWFSHDIRAPLQRALHGRPTVPLILITNKDADNVRSALNSGATHIVWLSEVQRKLHVLICTMRACGAQSRAAALLERSAFLPPLLRTALAYACRAEPPIRSVGELAALVRRDRRTLWRHWRCGSEQRPSLRLEDFLDWVIVLHAARLKAASRSWANVAKSLGTHEHTLARIAMRLANTSLSELAEMNHGDLEARFLETVVRPLASGEGDPAAPNERRRQVSSSAE